MGNTDSNESKAAGSTSEEDSARRQRENAATAEGATMAVAAAEWAITKLLSSSASEEDEKTNDKGKCMVAVGTSSKGKLIKATGGKLKMNTDGSVRGDPARAGFGGVIRDERGRWILGFYGRISRDHCTPEQAELWGIYQGLKIIQGEKLRGVEIESDSEPAIIHLQIQTRKKSPMNDIIEECKGMLQSTGCKLKQIGNKENKVADRLANLGRNQVMGLVRLTTPPDQETKILLEAEKTHSSEEDSTRRWRENTVTAVGVVTTVAAVAAAGWALTKLLSSSASEDDEKTEKTNGKGKSMVAVGTSSYRIPRNRFEDTPYDYFPDEKSNERQKMIVAKSYQIPSNEFEDSHSDSEDEETDEECPYPYQIKEGRPTRRDQQISGKPIRWCFPGYGKLKLNTDGSVKRLIKNKDGSVRYYINPPRAGFGGVIRDERGSLIVGFYGRLKDGCEVLEAELWGIYKGLEIIQGRNLREVEIESDSKSAIRLIKDDTAYNKSPFKELVVKCKAMKQETGCTLKHTLREGNRVADKLAKEGRDQYDNFSTFTTPPDKIIKMLLAADVAAASSY